MSGQQPQDRLDRLVAKFLDDDPVGGQEKAVAALISAGVFTGRATAEAAVAESVARLRPAGTGGAPVPRPGPLPDGAPLPPGWGEVVIRSGTWLSQQCSLPWSTPCQGSSPRA